MAGSNVVYVGNLPTDVRKRDIGQLFYKFGKITFIDLKIKCGWAFAFMEFEELRDAEDAVHARHGYDYRGYQLKVKLQ